MAINWDRLTAPFSEKHLEWRVMQAGLTKDKKVWSKVVCYVTNRAIMQRFDDVIGQENWQNSFGIHEKGVMSGIGIRIGATWVWKYDGAPYTQVEPWKGGVSDAMKRAAVQWGIGRYLYGLDEGWAIIVPDRDKAKYHDSLKKNPSRGIAENVFYHWNPPALPSWALPKGRDYYEMLGAISKMKTGIEPDEYYRIVQAYGVNHANEIDKDKMELALEWFSKVHDRNERFVRLVEGYKATVTELDFIGILQQCGIKGSKYEKVLNKDTQVKVLGKLEAAAKKEGGAVV